MGLAGAMGIASTKWVEDAVRVALPPRLFVASPPPYPLTPLNTQPGKEEQAPRGGTGGGEG